MTPSFEPLRSTAAPLICYIDYKSPYAFAALPATLRLADALGIEIDWRPLTLDIPSYLGKARLDSTGSVAESTRTPQQWSGVRYAYMDARRYVSAEGQALRGTTKIWDTSLIHLALMWVQRQTGAVDGPAVRALHEWVYPRFWRRDLDVEDHEVVCACIEAAGVPSTGFQAWVAAEGRALHDVQQAAVFDAGVFGVPGYVCAGEYFFGREHLPQIRSLLQGNAPADGATAYPLPQSLPEAAGAHDVFRELRQQALAGRLDVQVGFDVTCPQSALALPALERLATDARLRLRVRPLAGRALSEPARVSADAPRGERHRAHRAAYRLNDLLRDARWSGLGDIDRARLLRRPPASAAQAALAWADHHGGDSLRVARLLCDAYWSAGLDPAVSASVAAALRDVAGSGPDLESWLPEHGRAALAESTAQLTAGGLSQAFGFVAAGAPFVGRQHLAALRWALDSEFRARNDL